MANRKPDGIPVVSVRPSDQDFNQNPYPTYAEWHESHTAFWWEAYDQVCFADFETVNRLFRDRRFGREISHVMTREALGLDDIPIRLAPFYEFESRSMLEREPPAHTRLRKIVNRAFVTRMIDRLRPTIQELANVLIDDVEAEGSFDLISHYATPIPVTVIANMLGVPEERSQQLLSWSHAMVAMYQFGRSREVEDAAVKATQEFSSFIGELVDQRQGQQGDDLIGTLLAAEADGERLSRDELITNVILLLNAGHEATVHGIGNGVKTLLENKVRPDLIANGGPVVEKMVEECLRIDPPLHMFSRYVLEDCEENGISLRRGESIGLLIGAANHDPRASLLPGRFDPDRETIKHISFGAGLHFCIGAPLARLEMQIAFQELFRRLPGLSIVEEPVYADRYHFHGLERLMVAA